MFYIANLWLRCNNVILVIVTYYQFVGVPKLLRMRCIGQCCVYDYIIPSEGDTSRVVSRNVVTGGVL